MSTETHTWISIFLCLIALPLAQDTFILALAHAEPLQDCMAALAWCSLEVTLIDGVDVMHSQISKFQIRDYGGLCEGNLGKHFQLCLHL